MFWLNLRPSDERKTSQQMSQLEMGFAKASKSPKKDYFKVSI